MKVVEKIHIFTVFALFSLLTAGPAAAYTDVTEGSAPAYVKKSATEEKALQSSGPGVNVQGESGEFDDYLNDDMFPTDEEIRLMDVDPSSRVVLGAGDEGPAGVSYKKSYEKSPIAE